MVGLAWGGHESNKRLLKKPPNLRKFALVQSAIALLPLGWLLLIGKASTASESIPWLEPFFFLLTFLSGLVGGIQFPLADALFRRLPGVTERSRGVLYGVDLAGSSAGALVTASFIIPLLGMHTALWFFVILNGVIAAIIWAKYRLRTGS
jgi:MFS family permease